MHWQRSHCHCDFTVSPLYSEMSWIRLGPSTIYSSFLSPLLRLALIVRSVPQYGHPPSSLRTLFGVDSQVLPHILHFHKWSARDPLYSVDRHSIGLSPSLSLIRLIERLFHKPTQHLLSVEVDPARFHSCGCGKFLRGHLPQVVLRRWRLGRFAVVRGACPRENDS